MPPKRNAASVGSTVAKMATDSGTTLSATRSPAEAVPVVSNGVVIYREYKCTFYDKAGCDTGDEKKTVETSTGEREWWITLNATLELGHFRCGWYNMTAEGHA